MKLFGIIDGNKDASQIDVVLSKMAASFRVESEEYNKCCKDGGGVGHLSVTKLEGVRLMFDSSRNLHVMVCGRIYDYKKQGASVTAEEHAGETSIEPYLLDAKSIFRYFENHGKRFTANLDGTFLIVIWDRIENELIIINDRYGMKPLYYYAAMGKFVFASEVKAIIATEYVKKEIDWEGWSDIFSYGYVLGDKTLFRNIFSLPPASILTFKNDTVSITNYWRYEDIKVDYDESEEHFVNKGVDVIRNSIFKQTINLNKAQVLLSGGYDSRAIVCSLRFFTNVPVKTFTGILHTTGVRDMKYAALLSKKLGFENVQILENTDMYSRYFVDMIYLLDGLSFEPLWVMPLVQKLTAGIPSFDGIAGDIFFDEVHLLGARVRAAFDKLGNKFSDEEAVSIIHQNISLRNNELYRFFFPDVQSKIRPTLSSIRNEVRNLVQTDYLFSTFFIRNRTKNSVSLIPNNIVSTKTLVLFPFLENDLVQLSMSIPPEMKVRKQIYRKILGKAFPEAMKIPTTHDQSPLEVFVHSTGRVVKKILIDYEFIKIFQKLNRKLSKRIESKLSGSKLLALPPKKQDLSYLENLIEGLELPPFINKGYLFKEIATHKREQLDYSYFLVPIASFCIWYNLFYKDHPERPEDIKTRVKQNAHIIQTETINN